MENILRLAEARGSLQAPNSPVQDLALRMVLLLKEKAHQGTRLDGIRMAMLTGNPSIDRVQHHFPEYFPSDWKEQRAFEAATKDGVLDIDALDDSSITWATPANDDEDDEISRWISERENGTTTLEDLEHGWR